MHGQQMLVSEPQRPQAGEEILSAIQVARELRCSKAHVYKVIQGKVEGVSCLPAISMGRRKLVRRTALEQWKQVNEQQAVTSGRC
jgi:hypothetical protein